jgi:PBSX family phage portal protein
MTAVTKPKTRTRQSTRSDSGRFEDNSDEHAMSILRAAVAKRGDDSRQLPEDDSFASAHNMAGSTVKPPYDIETLCDIFSQSNTLRQCIDAMVTNTCSFGVSIVAVSEDTPIDEAERKMLQSILDYANPDESMITVRSKMSDDRHRLGYGFVEVMRDSAGGLAYVRHIKSRYVRLIKSTGRSVTVTRKMPRGDKEIVVKESRRFRTFVQVVNGDKVYYKEFGDKRNLDYTTGKFESRSARVPPNKQATELIHFREYTDDSYGYPKWVHQMPAILGSREAEEVNYNYFRDNMVPAIALLISGGRLTNQAFRTLQETISSGIGKDRQNKFMLLEAIAEKEGLDDKGNVTMKVEKMADARPSDGLFDEYDKANQAKVRGAYRLPPSIVGQSQDVTYATANVAASIAETQIFEPARRSDDERFNRTVVNGVWGLNLKTVKLKSVGPSITNPEQIVKSMTALNVMGGVTPRTAIEMARKDLNIDLPKYPEKGEEGYEDWMDKPLPMAIKEMLAANKGINEDSDILQGAKTDKNKETEATGEVGKDIPEHGSE